MAAEDRPAPRRPATRRARPAKAVVEISLREVYDVGVENAERLIVITEQLGQLVQLQGRVTRLERALYVASGLALAGGGALGGILGGVGG